MSDAATAAQERVSSQKGGYTAPYFDLNASITVAEVIYHKGGGACTGDQLAHWLEYKTVRSGTFLTRVSAANKHFGLIAQEGDKFIVNERANKILAPVMPDDAANAKVEAFLSVPLFAKVYEQFRGSGLPRETGLKNLFLQNYKVVPDRVASAVRIFLNSAEQAGMLTPDRTRLIRPGGGMSRTIGTAVEKDEAMPITPVKSSTAPAVETPGSVHSAIIGLLRELPPPGTVWPEKKKKQFLDAFRATLDFIYQDEESAP